MSDTDPVYGQLFDTGGAVYNVQHPSFGAHGDGRQVGRGAMQATQNVLTISEPTFTGFTQGDVGKTMVVSGAGPGGGALVSTITAVPQSTQATLQHAAERTVSLKTVTYGHDDTAAIQNAWNAAVASAGCCYLPAGIYLISLTGSAGSYGPALRLAGGGDKERQPRLLGESRGVTLAISLPPDAPRDLEVIRIEKGTLTDNPRGIALENFRLVNLNTPSRPAVGLQGITGNGTTATATTTAPHGLETGFFAEIDATGASPYDGTWRITGVPSPTQFTFAHTSTVGASGGTVGDSFLNPIDYWGTGIRTTHGWTGQILRFQISGFCVGMDEANGYARTVGDGEIRNCNVGLWVSGTTNANRYRTMMFRDIHPALTSFDTITDIYPADPKLAVGRRYGAAVLLSGDFLGGGVFESLNMEAVGVPAWLVGPTPNGVLIVNSRMESCAYAFHAPGPLTAGYSHGVVVDAPLIDCDSLQGPAVYLNRAYGWNVRNPSFYQRGTRRSESDVAVLLGTDTRYCVISNPVDFTAAATAAVLDDAIVDQGQGNLVHGPVLRPTHARAYRTTDHVVGNDASGPLPWTGAVLLGRMDGSWSGATPERVVIPGDGMYDVRAMVAWAAAAGGYRRISIRVNGKTRAAASQAPGAAELLIQQCALTWEFKRGDYVEVWVRQTSGQALAVAYQDNYAPEVTITRRQ
ncbi:MAG TPA: hypothetical protein VHG08_09980 [Longimicrobium sp.]|nr:hypothetical protein [Longimicrobium sp.]